jgi:uncharacterized protein
MTEEAGLGPTFIGRVASVLGGSVSVKLVGLPSTLVLVEGQSYRVGQIGAFLRIPLGYTSLYGVCTQVGAGASPTLPPGSVIDPTLQEQATPSGHRWLTLTLFGEALGDVFDRGVGQYPTVGDPVHLVTPGDLELIYAGNEGEDSLLVGRIASSAGLPARLQLSTLVSRHSAVVGSTGSGKSNLVAVVLGALSAEWLPSARTLIVDPHGEYASAVGDKAEVIHTGVEVPEDCLELRVPFWALPFDELLDLTMGQMQPNATEALRDKVASMKRSAAKHLADPPPPETITADSPVPFSIERFWFELEEQQRMTFERNTMDLADRCDPIDPGDPDALRPPEYPPASLGSAAPFLNRNRLPISKQVDLLHSRLSDARFRFMFDRTSSFHPDRDGRVAADLDTLLTTWVGHDKPITILDVSGLPPEVVGSVVGTMLRLIYDALFWAMSLPVGGRNQPLLIILEEAHRFLPANSNETAAHRIVSRIAREGRKYGAGLMIVTQRPSDIDGTVLSQCGTMIALRVTNPSDRAAVAGMVSDDLGGLAELLPSLRTGEALVLGDALQVPSRIRVTKAPRKPVGDDPPLPGAWMKSPRPDQSGYADAVKNWRYQSTSAAVPTSPEGFQEAPTSPDRGSTSEADEGADRADQR